MLQQPVRKLTSAPSANPLADDQRSLDGRGAVRTPSSPTGGRLVAMWLILCSLPVIALVVLVLGYYTYQKLAYPAYACGSFAQLDDTIGWVLRPSATSCLGAHEPFSAGERWFEAPVYTDRNGFRAAQPGGDTPIGGVMLVGDSFTFGFGLTWEQSFAAQLGAAVEVPTIIAASPAYSAAQALLLAERWAPRLRPRAIVYLDNGMWTRDACRGGSRPTAIEKPCYWQPPGGAEAELVLPPPGRVAGWSRWGVLPGGVIGAGETGWDYFLVTRPAYQGLGLLARLGIVPGFAHDFAAVGVDDEVIRRASMRHLARLAKTAGVPLILLDPTDAFTHAVQDNPEFGRIAFERVDSSAWQEAVAGPAQQLLPDERTVPHDEHFGPGTNRLIAALLARELPRLGVATGN